MRHNPLKRCKIASAFFALLVLFVTTSNTALAEDCSVSCLRVFSIEASDLDSSIHGVVRLTDENGSATGARSSIVHLVWTRPDGSIFDQYAMISSRLRAEFSLSTAGAPGTYTLTVAGATKSGYTFDPDNSSIVSKSITVGIPPNSAPTAVPNADVVSGSTPLTVHFDSYGSVDPDGTIVTYDWNFGDGNSSSEASPSHIYQGPGKFNAALTVTDDMGATASSSTSITVNDSSADCVSNCMSVDRVSMRYDLRKNRIRGLVWLVDENDRPVEGAVVHATWTLPDGSTIDKYSTISRRLRASFSLTANTPGRYTLSIVEVTKAGHTFTPDFSNVLTDSIDIAP